MPEPRAAIHSYVHTRGVRLPLLGCQQCHFFALLNEFSHGVSIHACMYYLQARALPNSGPTVFAPPLSPLEPCLSKPGLRLTRKSFAVRLSNGSKKSRGVVEKAR